MTVDTVTEIVRNALYTIIISAAPMLLAALVVGLVISIFQTVTSIQEQTLTFVPKILSVFLVLMLAGHWIINNIIGYMEQLWSSFSLYIR
ncbi:MAG: flagellar biosynthesis protein FliQ [Lachnospiraceae bacterium]|nr:flagellar biosynthesis protein FliQ [Lachnospiraceae bacterium]